MPTSSRSCSTSPSIRGPTTSTASRRRPSIFRSSRHGKWPDVNTARPYSSDVAFTETVKALQRSKGSRRAYERMEEGGSWETRITPPLRAFVAASRSFFLATANREGQPYIQHRGGPPGFLRVIDEQTLGFADFAGNRQYITLGNL